VHDGTIEGGTRRLRWDGTGSDGKAVGPGVYLVRAELGGRVLTRRVVRLR
jgi:hypothetical protein